MNVLAYENNYLGITYRVAVLAWKDQSEDQTRTFGRRELETL